MNDQDRCNQLIIAGELVALDDLRYTPAGIARIGLRIQHFSNRLEAGTSRQVSCELPALALGDIALQASRMKLGQLVTAEGFLAQRSFNNKQLVLHLNEIKLYEGV